jgi:hypothetical protein
MYGPTALSQGVERVISCGTVNSSSDGIGISFEITIAKHQVYRKRSAEILVHWKRNDEF